MATLPAQDTSTEKLPVSPMFLVVRLGLVAILIPISWLWLGPLAAAASAAALALVMLLFAPRALVLDERGFRQLSLVPRKKVLWSIVDSFGVGSSPRVGTFVRYAKAGRRARWWYPAGWPAQGSIPPAFTSQPGGRAFSAGDLADLLNERLARARAAPRLE